MKWLPSRKRCLSPDPFPGTQCSVGQVAGRWSVHSTRPPRRCDRFIPSPLSCVLLRPAPPVARTRLLNCLAQAAASLRWSYSGHSHQSAAFQTPVDSRHRIPLRPPHSLRGYSCPAPQQSRQLDAFASALTSHVRSSRSGIVSNPATGLISGNRIQKRSLTHPD